MALTTDEQANLALYQAAYAKLIAGQAVASATNASGRRVDFTKADLDRLEREISRLEAKALAPDTALPPRARGAFRFRIH